MQHHHFRRHIARATFATAALALVSVSAGAAAARPPKDLNTALERPTDHGVFQVTLRSQAQPLRVGPIHQWTVHLEDAAGAPVSNAQIGVDGGMPQHHHGLPTQPRAAPAGAPGDYVINGMKFSMTGWWELKLNVTAVDGRSDRITFNVVL